MRGCRCLVSLSFLESVVRELSVNEQYFNAIDKQLQLLGHAVWEMTGDPPY